MNANPTPAPTDSIMFRVHLEAIDALPVTNMFALVNEALRIAKALKVIVVYESRHARYTIHPNMIESELIDGLMNHSPFVRTIFRDHVTGNSFPVVEEITATPKMMTVIPGGPFEFLPTDFIAKLGHRSRPDESLPRLL